MGDGRSDVYRESERNNKIEEFIKINKEAAHIAEDIESLEFLIDKMYKSIRKSEKTIIEKKKQIINMFEKDTD